MHIDINWSTSVVLIVEACRGRAWFTMASVRKEAWNGRGPSSADVDDGEVIPEERVAVIVGGTRHETTMSCLLARGNTRLGDMARRHIQSGRREFVFDRHPGVFSSVIDYYRSGGCWRPIATEMSSSWRKWRHFRFSVLGCYPWCFKTLVFQFLTHWARENGRHVQLTISQQWCR